ncbi:MAG: tRNA (adenosine(37)-N6)-threonylcarbamoyltransferase complex ATPase subunit type 1 TsaE [Sulfurimonadaceae bacterium]|nr:tRNA (adenosine(37)-N6)-threonylcarbamoyltransferase complex ATPase subunit type 1 TsaE [Sulfurimonadaceae bacterium]
MKTLQLNLEELPAIASVIKEMLPQGGVVVLRDDLAAGKTTLVKTVVKAFGIDETVTSPTFSLQQCYGDTLFHYDIYSHGFEHFISLGMFEELERPGYHFVEWGDEALIRLLKSAHIETIVIDIEKGENTRQYKVEHA